MYATKKRKFGIPILAAVLFVLFVVSSLVFRHEVVAGDVWALGVSLGGMSRDAALETLRDKVREIEQGPLLFVAGSRSIEIGADKILLSGDEYAMEQTLDSFVGSAPRLWPAFLTKRGEKKVMAAPIRVAAPVPVEVLDEIAAALSAPPEGTRYDFEGRELKVLSPSDGQAVTREDVAAALGRIEGTRVEVPYEVIQAPAAVHLPELQMIGEFSTPYDTQDTDRNVNLALAAQAIHKAALKPGEVFSFNKAAGERTEEKGYRWANVVVGDHLELGLAGGICQVTTTLFDAAFLAGLDFPYVTAHGIPVDYVPPGWDAAVAWDYLDLKVKNNTESPVVFGAWVEDGQVTVRVFGEEKRATYEFDAVTVAEYPSPGKRPGLLVETYRIKKVDGEVVERKLIMRNTYQPSYPPPEK